MILFQVLLYLASSTIMGFINCHRLNVNKNAITCFVNCKYLQLYNNFVNLIKFFQKYISNTDMSKTCNEVS